MTPASASSDVAEDSRTPDGAAQPWEELGEAPAVRADGVPMYRRRTGRRVRSFDEDLPERHGSVQAVRDALIVLLVALLITFVSKHVLASTYVVGDDSMQPTLAQGDRVFVNVMDLTLSEADRGDIVVFRTPHGGSRGAEEDGFPLGEILRFLGLAAETGPEYDVKRVIAVGGDRVACCDAQGRILVNDTPLREHPGALPEGATSEESFDLLVPEQSYFVMGDHRAESSDSLSRLRTDQIFVGHEDVVGTAFVIGWPLDRVGPIPSGKPAFEDVPSTVPPSRQQRGL